MSFRETVGLAAGALALLGGALALLSSDAGEVPSVAHAPSVSVARAEAEVAALVTRTIPLQERVQVQIEDPRTQSRLARIAQRALELNRRPTLKQVVVRARQRGRRDLLAALESHLRRYPDDASGLIAQMRVERDPVAFFLMARALSRSLDDVALRRQTIALLRTLEAQRRGDGLVALLGRKDTETTGFLLGLLERDRSPLVRQRAASVLAGVLRSLPPQDQRRARWVARRWLSAPGPSTRARVAAASLLGQPGAKPADVKLLCRELDRSRDTESVSALTHGLCLAGMGPRAVRAALTGLLERGSTPDALKRSIRKMLVALAGAPS